MVRLTKERKEEITKLYAHNSEGEGRGIPELLGEIAELELELKIVRSNLGFIMKAHNHLVTKLKELVK
jgi:hypothetical protein